MRNQLENRLTMFYSVKQVCESHTGVYGGLTPFVTAFDALKVNLGALEGAIAKQEVNLKGVALDKQRKRDTMVDQALAVAHALYAYAVDRDDLPLQERARHSRTSLNRGRDAIVGQRCQGVHADAALVGAALADYGVEAAELTALQAAIDAYVAVIGSPRAALTIRKGATAEIELLVAASMKILYDRMDKLMAEFKVSAPAFHQEYFDARIIVDTGARSTSTEPEAPAQAA